MLGSVMDRLRAEPGCIADVVAFSVSDDIIKLLGANRSTLVARTR